MVTSARVARRKESTRQRIVEAAMALFLAQGFERTSVAQISEAADIGKGTFFTYFATKQDVLSFLGEQVLDTMKAADRPEAAAPERLRSIFAAAADWFAANEEPARQMCIACLSTLTSRDVTSSREPLLQLLATIIRDGMAANELRPVNLDSAVMLLASAYFAPVAAWAWSQSDRPLADQLSAQLELALSALAV
ncbi:Fatty acid metabolism regulator protein [Dermatophilus congolensis]|uniref:Fatty acid metabolism regulator protein n=1 Tax=Dermatophilus congolensis TaxID=1863 RepID=A0AA46BPW0_9MICO|nr:TetR/AcrR family transcriptional regulator [Dermatophilus congolensis]STD14334.1 Fatty acid metabolism regulator protein [Dermatophilus congolensis]